MRRLTVLIATLIPSLVGAVDPTVHLSYASYQGSVLSNGISQWLGIRYAKSPLNERRFAAPQHPSVMNDLQHATSHGKRCIGLGQTPSDSLGEDCLFLDVYAPSQASNTSNLPVYLFIQGGGFNTNSNANYNGSGLILASDQNIVVVNFNYRVGPYGFLAGREVKAGGSINNGLKDQRKVMQWVQKYIRQFGGNPDHVVIGGASAGAASVTLHLAAYGGRNDNLFHGTAAESQSFGTVLTADEAQYQYDNLLKQTSCSSASDTLACLRGVDLATFQKVANNIPYAGRAGAPLYMYSPVVDGDFIQQLTVKSFQEGKFVKVPAIFGDDTDEGSIFCPKNTATLDASNTFINNQFYFLNSNQLSKIGQLYPKAEQFPDSGAYWRQCSNAYGEIRYICPGIWLSNYYSQYKTPVWNYRWNVIDPAANASGIGVSHTIEVNAIWGPGADGTKSYSPESYNPGGENSAIIPVVQGYWTSFIRSLDPNKYRKSDTPTWEQWTSSETQRLKFQTRDTKMETETSDQKKRCDYIESIALDIRQ